MELIDLTHPIVPGMVTYPGLPEPVMSDYLDFESSRAHYAAGTEFRIGRVELITSTGTYMDSPAHRFPIGEDIASLELARCANLRGIIVDARGCEEVPAEAIPGEAVGCAVLIYTGWDTHWGTERYGSHEHPSLSEAAANKLVASGAVLVGIDSVNIDGTMNDYRPVHTTLLENDVLIVENLTRLSMLMRAEFTFSAIPLPFEGAPSFPVRAFAQV